MASAAQNITRHFEGDWHGSYGAIPAPGHSRHDRGVTVKDTNDGDVVFNSFNGADWRQIKDECRSLGLIPERSSDRSSAGWRDTGTYEYTDADGAVLYRTVRREKLGEKKRFVAQRPNGRGGWETGMGDVARVLYRLPEILAADPGDPVYLVEGERKADKLASWGLVATAIAFGAKGWRDSYATALAGRTVVILPDNDVEGRAFADRVCASIGAAGGKPFVVDLPGLGPKQDIINWTGTAGELQALTNVALTTAPAQDDPLGEMITVASLAGVEPRPMEWIVEDMLPVGAVTTLFGDGGLGKTLVAMQIGTAVATGTTIFGFETQTAPVLGFFCEDPMDELHRRFSSICRGEGILQTRVTGFAYQSRFGRESLLGVFADDGAFRPSVLLNAIRDRAHASGARLIILDNILHLYPGGVNDPGEVTRFLAALNRLALDINGAVLLLGHIAKSAGSQFAGTMAWSNASRSRLFLGRPGDLAERPTDDAEAAFVDPDVRILARMKANYAPISAPMEIRWHQGAFTRPGDLPTGMADQLAETTQASADNVIFLTCLAERNRQQRPVSERRSPTYAPTIFAAMAESKKIGKRRLEAAMDRLFRTGQIERGFLWRDGAEGKDKHGLRETSANANPAPANGPANAPLTRSADARPQSPPTPANIHSISKDITGAAPGSAAPSPRDDFIAGWDR